MFSNPWEGVGWTRWRGRVGVRGGLGGMVVNLHSKHARQKRLVEEYSATAQGSSPATSNINWAAVDSSYHDVGM